MNHVVPIFLSGAARAQTGERTLGVFEALLPIRFVSGEGAPTDTATAIRIEGPTDDEERPGKGRKTAFTVVHGADVPNESRAVELDVKFCDDVDVPTPFRGRTVRASLSAAWKPLSMGAGDKPLATTAHGPIWSVSEEGPVKHIRSALPLPRIAEGEGFIDVFNGDCFLPTLILLEFLKRSCAMEAYHRAPLRAAFMVDDPNLHWPRYGFVDYRDVATHASRENYHVSFAMIPMDTWFTHRPTAALLRGEAQRLSLLVHGNNHAREELAKKYPDAERAALLHQAIRRIERFEGKAGLRVHRVMVPPHGACSSKMLAALPKAGFEAACISTNSLRAYNGSEAWTATAGYAPSEVIAGCPVLPRWGLTGSVRNNVLIAAYLGQALIFRGHHQDLKDGLEVFDDLARMINGLGPVRWSNLSSLCRLNYQWRMDGTVCRLRPYGRAVEFDVPPQATSLCIDDVPRRFESQIPWTVTTEAGFVHDVVAGDSFELADRTGRTLLVSRPVVSRPALSPAAPRTGPKLILRRLLAEARDRLLVG